MRGIQFHSSFTLTFQFFPLDCKFALWYWWKFSPGSCKTSRYSLMFIVYVKALILSEVLRRISGISLEWLSLKVKYSEYQSFLMTKIFILAKYWYLMFYLFQVQVFFILSLSSVVFEDGKQIKMIRILPFQYSQFPILKNIFFCKRFHFCF